MATLTISPVIPVPLTPLLGGTGVANSNSDTLTVAGGAFTLQAGIGFSIAAGSGPKTLTINNTLTFSGTDATTMTFPATSTTVAGLSIAQTFSVPQIVSTSTNATSLTVTNNTITTGGTGIVYISSTSVTGGSGGVMLYLEHTTSTFTNPALYIRMAVGSGTFTGDHILCSVNDVNKFIVASDGSTTIAGSLSVGGSSIYNSSGQALWGNKAPGGATSTATLGRVPTGESTAAMTGWLLIGLVSGSAVRVPYWLDT
jgi:hypothetical protein